MRTILLLIAAILPLNLISAQFAGGGPQPGDIYKEYTKVMTGEAWRVTEEPNAQTNPGALAYYPNPVLNIDIDDLVNAVRAEIVIDFWAGHEGTVDKKFRFNNNTWIDISEITTTPAAARYYMYQTNYIIDIPLSHLLQGTNSFEGSSGSNPWHWGQWGWYGVIVRIYYESSKADFSGSSITSPISGSTIIDHPSISVSAQSSVGVNNVDILAYYEGYDSDGDGVYLDWQRNYHIAAEGYPIVINNHVGTLSGGAISLVWNTTRIPDQLPGNVKLQARIQDINGYWSVTPIIDSLTLSRTNFSVNLFKASEVLPSFWVGSRIGKEHDSCNINIPSGTNLANATDVQLHVSTWNGIDKGTEPYSTNINSYNVIPESYGVDHFYSYDTISIPNSALNIGDNKIKFNSVHYGHHGIEVLWPGPSLIARFGEIPVRLGPVISQHPQNDVVEVGQSATFSLTATGNGTLTYQWEKDRVAITGATSSSYITPPTLLSDSGAQFTCIVNDDDGSFTSNIATLTVLTSTQRAADGLQVLYTFEEGAGTIINDVSGTGTPLNLNINSPAATAWTGHGLTVLSSASISSLSAGSKIVSACKSTNEITIEVWLKPATTIIDNSLRPARIVSFSNGSSLRNFTLGQGAYNVASDLYDIRLRTTTTGTNGSSPSLSSNSGTLTTDTTHVVYTRSAGGIAKIYVNGSLVKTGTISGDLSNWDSSHFLHLANESTGDRPWTGEFLLASVYNRVLTDTEVLQHFAHGENIDGQEPSITVDPSNQTVAVGQSATFYISVFGTPPFTLMWQKNGIDISGSDSVAYTTPPLSLADSGSTFRCIVTNSFGSDTSSSAVLSVVETTGGPVIDVWYGTTQNFGHLGNPQRWINILGNVSDQEGVASLSYRLNGGPSINLSIGTDTRRLKSEGDFNIDIDTASLQIGANTVLITAEDVLSDVSNVFVTVNYSSGNSLMTDYTFDWDTVSNVQNVAQVVDGKWEIDNGMIHPLIVGYDRLIAIGNNNWSDYEVTVPIEVNSIFPIYDGINGGAAVGLIAGWTGHTDNPISGWQPKTGFYPYGAIAWYAWKNTSGNHPYELLGNNLISIAQTASSTPFDLNELYIFKLRVETTGGGVFYSFKAWKSIDTEPDWILTGLSPGGLSDPMQGSILLVAHNVDASYGDVMVVPYGVVPVELTSFTLAVNENTAILKWETATEVQNHGFEIERKTVANEDTWNTIGFVNGHGNSNVQQIYSFVDDKLFGGTKFIYRLKQIDQDGKFEYSNEIEADIVPDEFKLYQNYPNPFNPTTTIRFSIKEAQAVKIRLFNQLGEEVGLMANNHFEAGYHEFEFNASILASGIYFYRMETNNYTDIKKMMLLK